MNAVRMISWIHVLWGLSLMLGGISAEARPFGQLEAFLTIVERWGFPQQFAGLIFFASGLMALIILQHTERFHKHPIFVPLGLLPQQLILLVALGYAVRDLWHHYDERIFYAGITQLVFATFHTFGMYILYKVVIIAETVAANRARVDGERKS